MAKTNESRVDVELLLQIAVNKLEDKNHLDDVTFVYDDRYLIPNIILGKLTKLKL